MSKQRYLLLSWLKFTFLFAILCNAESLFHEQLRPRQNHQEQIEWKSSVPKIHNLNKKYLTLGNSIALNIAVIIFAGPNVSSFRLDHISHHIVYKSMLIPNLEIFKLFYILFIIDFLEDILEPSIVFLQNGVFGG